MNKTSVVIDGHTVSYWKYQLIDKLYSYNNEVDTFKVSGREIYVLRYRDKGKSVMTPGFIEKKLKTKCTTRNRKTALKLLDLYQK